MSKESGLGDYLFIDGYDVSGDTAQVASISAPFAPIVMTGINKYAPERVAGQMDGALGFTVYHNPTNAHVKLSALPRTNVIGSYFHGLALGNVCASLQALQVSYDPSRGDDGSLTMAVALTASAGTSLEWGVQGTPGKRSDVAATNGASVDGGASTAFGLQAYAHFFSFTGTSCTLKLQDSADNATFADLTGGGFVAATAAGSQFIATTATQTIRRYVRVVSSGTFSQCTFAVNLIRNNSALTP